jgi:hypothetical protein
LFVARKRKRTVFDLRATCRNLRGARVRLRWRYHDVIMTVGGEVE